MISSLIDRNGRLPYYHQVAMHLEQRIARGEWPLGGRLPSENDLAKEYAVSRMTIRQALDVLQNDELIRRQRPTGTFVARRPPKLASTLSIPVNFLRDLNRSGHTSEVKLETISVGPIASEEAAQSLGLEPHQSAIHYERSISMHGAAFARVQSIVPSALCPGLERFPVINDSIHATIETHFGIAIVRADHWIEAAKASDVDLAMLKATVDSPILVLTSLYYDRDDRPIEYVMTYWLADVMKLHLQTSVKGQDLLGH